MFCTGFDLDGIPGTDTDEHSTFRDYSSTQGRWLSMDPYAGSYNFANPQGFNRYVYASNNPFRYIDPDGTSDYCDDGGCYYDVSSGGYDQSSSHGGSESLGSYFVADMQSILGGVAPSELGSDQLAPYMTESIDTLMAKLAAAGFAASNASQTGHYEANILNAANNKFGTHYTSANVSSTFQYSTEAPPGKGTLNLNVSGPTAGVSPGYYPVNWWTYIIGYGPTLHAVTGPGEHGGLTVPKPCSFRQIKLRSTLTQAFHTIQLAPFPIGC